jgi:outer membrane protein TolC
MVFRGFVLSRRGWKRLAKLALVAALLPGCSGSDKQLTYLGDAAFCDYEDKALQIDQPAVDEPTPENVAVGRKPRTLGDRTRDEVWDLSLAEVIHLALINNRILRVRGDYRSAGSSIFTNPDGIASTYDAAIRESGVLFGGRGVEAALADFDTQWSTNMVWGYNSQRLNNLFLGGGLAPGGVLNQDTANFTTSLRKNFGYGATMQVGQTWNYNWSDQPAQLFPSVYTGNLGFNYTQPLWAGAGAEFTRIAGPLNPNFQGITGVNQGVTIARINVDMTLVEFEAQVRNMLKDVEETYWDLYLAYRSYDALIEARNSVLRSWRFADANKGAGKFNDLDEGQARDAYFEARVATEDALQNLYALETQLRRLCGLPSTDGRIIRPSDEPLTNEFIPEWHASLAEGLTHRQELRRQKWNIKSLELQLCAAQSLTNPQFNFVSSYQLNGFGNDLFGSDGPPGTPGADLQSAYRQLFQGDQHSWTAGFQFSMPLGFRSANAQVRNIELRLAKARDVLAMQELEVSHELTTAFQNLAWRYQTAQTNYNRWQTAESVIPGRESRYRSGVPGIDTSILLDQWLQARRRAVQAEIAFYTSVIEYNKALTDLHFRKGTLLEVNNVHLAEGMWTPEAYKDAIRRAWARSFAFDAPNWDPVHTEPQSLVREGYLGTVEFMGEPATGPTLQREHLQMPDAVPPAPAAPVTEAAQAAPPAIQSAENDSDQTD